MTKTEYVLQAIAAIKADAYRQGPANDLAEALGPLEKRMQAKKTLGHDPTASKAPEVIEGIRKAVSDYNKAVQIKAPDEALLIAGLSAAEEDTPTEL